ARGPTFPRRNPKQAMTTHSGSWACIGLVRLPNRLLQPLENSLRSNVPMVAGRRLLIWTPMRTLPASAVRPVHDTARLRGSRRIAARRSVPQPDSARRWIMACTVARLRVPTVFREWFSVRPRPVDLDGSDSMGSDGAPGGGRRARTNWDRGLSAKALGVR